VKRFRAISVDDEPAAHDALRALLRDIADIELAASHTQAEAALAALRAEAFDLLFLDISMPGMGGLELLQSLAAPPATVLLTAHAEHALAAFELGVSDYLLKPVSADRLARCLEHVRPLLEARAGSGGLARQIAVKVGTAHRILDPGRILRVQAEGNFSLLVLEGGERVLASEPLKELEQRLAPFGFLRSHKSHLVALAQVSAMSALELRLHGGESAPIGRAYRLAVSDRLREA
jgi:DNA-binding LytR/AlgR family response regulator